MSKSNNVQSIQELGNRAVEITQNFISNMKAGTEGRKSTKFIEDHVAAEMGVSVTQVKPFVRLCLTRATDTVKIVAGRHGGVIRLPEPKVEETVNAPATNAASENDSSNDDSDNDIVID